MDVPSLASNGALSPAPATPSSTGSDPARGAPTLEESFAELRSMAERRAGKIPADMLARHVLDVTPDADWPVRRAAMEALLRRRGFGDRDSLVVTQEPRSVFGRYATARASAPRKGRPRRTASRRAASSEARPYMTLLTSLEPLRGSCDCADYLRGSLGLCKHLLAVLEHLHARRARPAASSSSPPSTRARPTLRWDPVRSLTGPGDRLVGLRWLDATRPTITTAAVRRAKRCFRALAGGGGERRLLESKLGALADRDTLLRALEDGLAPAGGLDAEPAARAIVREERQRLDRRLEGRRTAGAVLAHLSSLKRPAYPYQREGVRRFFEEEHLLLADDMGLGKTTQAVAACHALHRAGRVERGLLIVPAALKPQWVREWQATSDAPIASIDGPKAERDRQYRAHTRGFLIIGYEQLLRDLAEVHAFDPQIVVLDEAQRIKNWATKSAAYVKTLRPRYRLVLTGTPMENRLEELASVLDWLDDVALTPKWRLEPWHTYVEGDGGRGRSGARNLDTLRTRLEPVLVRRVRKEVLAQLPPRTDTRVSVPMTDAQRAEHDDLVRPIAQILSRAKQRPLRQAEFLRLMTLLNQQRMISNGLGQVRFEELWPVYQKARPDPLLLEGLFAPKLAELRRIVEEVVVRQGRKAVVFSQWRRMLRLAAWATRDLLEDAGLRASFFTGAESQRVRTQNIVDFHDDASSRIMFLSDAGGVGLNLQRAASSCINLELPWNPAVLEQRIGRIYRLGQEQPIDVYTLVTDYGIESRIADLVGRKRALFSGLFDGTTDEIAFEGGRTSFLADVEKLVPEVPEIPQVQGASAEDGLEEATEEEETAGSSYEAPEAFASLPAQAPASTRPSAPDTGSLPVEQSPPPSGSPDVAELFASVRIERTVDGGLRFEAPPAAASTLASLFEGMARLLRPA